MSELMVEGKECVMRILISVKELGWFKENFPLIKWEPGHTEIKWNSNVPEEVEMARKAFEAYKQKHPKAMAFRMNKDDKKDVVELKEFDPNAEMIVVQDWMQKG